MWISKEGEVRKQELLKAAFELFTEKGYDHTSINDIIARVGVTKGAFYYYFTSREEILEVLACRQAEGMITITEKIAADPGLSALEKLNRIITEVYTHRFANLAVRLKTYQVLEHEGNLKLVNRTRALIMERAHPAMLSIINQGISERTLSVPYPEETAELYIELSSLLNNSLNQLLASNPLPVVREKIRQKLLFYELAMTRILGVEKNALYLAEPVMRMLEEL